MAQRSTLRRAAPVFQFRGWEDGWYVLRANTARHPLRAVHAFENAVLEWLIEQTITPNELSYLANGNTGDGPRVPAAEDGSLLCLLLRRPTDVLRFRRAFACRGITPDAFLAAVEREASVHKFVLSDIAQVAYRAIHEYAARFDEVMVEWADLENDARQLLLLTVREYLEMPNRTAEQQHQAWVDTRQREEWQYGALVDYRRRRHPWMVPFARLPVNEQMKSRLLAGVVASLAGGL